MKSASLHGLRTVALLVGIISFHSASAAGSLIRDVTWYGSGSEANPVVTDVLLVDGLIAQVGTGLTAPGVTEVIDGRGLHMTAALFTARTQLGLDELDLELTTVDSRLGEFGLTGPAFDIQYAFNPASVAVNVNLVEGVVYGVLAPRVGPDLLAGYGAVANFGTGKLLARRTAMFGASGAVVAAKFGGSRAENIGRLRRALSALPGFRARGYVPNPGEYSRADMLALGEMVKERKPLVMHAHRAADIRELLRLAADFDLQLVLSGATEAWQVAGELAAADVAVILDPLENLPLSFEQLGARLDNAALLHAAGVTLAIVVSDLHNTRLLRQHAGNAVAHGLPWPVGLAAITRAPAQIFGLQVGRLQQGSAATFVLWSGDPLEVTTYAQAVMVDGRWIDPTSRQTRLFERYRDLDDTEATGFKYR